MSHIILIISIPILMLVSLWLKRPNQKPIFNLLANLVFGLVIVLVILLPFLTIKYIETL